LAWRFNEAAVAAVERALAAASRKLASRSPPSKSTQLRPKPKYQEVFNPVKPVALVMR
jgi:hypothetical protein